MTEKGRSLRQEEIDGCWRYDFVRAILEYIDSGMVAKFVVLGSSSGLYRLIEVSKCISGEWHFSASGKDSMYTYKYGDLVHWLEQIWGGTSKVFCFDGEIGLVLQKPKANDDAEPDTLIEKESYG